MVISFPQSRAVAVMTESTPQSQKMIAVECVIHQQLTNPSSGTCNGFIFNKGGVDENEYGPVILTSGDYNEESH